MSASARKGHKRTDTFLELRKASLALKQAGDRLITAGEALIALRRTLNHLQLASRMAQNTRFDWQENGRPLSKANRDGLPAPLRRAIERECRHVEALMAKIKAVPVTSDERAMAKTKRGSGS